MQKRHIVSVLGAFTAIGSLAFGGNPIDDPYGDPGCPPYTSSETQGSNGSPSNPSSSSGGKISDPISLATGDYQLVQVDLTIPGRGMDFEIRRFYRSLSGLQAVLRFEDTPRELIGLSPATSMGDHWYFNYDIRLSFPKPTFTTFSDPNLTDPIEWEPAEILPDRISVLSGTGRIDPYTQYGTGEYSNEHFARKLVFTQADEPVYLYESDMTVYEFFPAYESVVTDFDSTSIRLPYAGRLKSITDRNGNQIQFNWETSLDGIERIDIAIDTLSHTIDFVYHDQTHNGQLSSLSNLSNASGLLWKVVDHADREVVYGYTEQPGAQSNVFMMTSATLPAIEDSSQFDLPIEHARFTSGQVWSYEYNENNVMLWGGRMLEKVTSPNGDVVLENDYNYYGQQEEPNTIRVIRQKYGQSEYNYLLTDLQGNYLNLSLNFNMPDDYYVWVNDRRGAITRLKYRGEDSNTPGFYRQLLEETVYEGLVSDPKKSTFATVDQNGNPTAWFYLDESNDYANYNTPIPHSGPGGVASPVSYTDTYETNDNWNVTGYNWPVYDLGGMDTVNFVMEDSISAPNNPLKWGAKLSRTQHAANTPAIINETWDYSRFDFGGCGCGGRGFETGFRDGNGNYTLKEYDTNINSITGRPTGDLLAIYHDLSTGDFNTSYAAAQGYAAAVERFEYNDWGQVTKYTHSQKTILDDNGNEVDHRQVDRFVYYSLTAHPNNAGRLKQRIIDGLDNNSSTSSNSQMTTTYEYDAIGNVTKETRPNGDISEYLYNQAAELVQEIHYDQSGPSGKPYAQIDYFYDANGNLVREEVANLDSNRDPVSSNPTITTVFEYNIHNIPTIVSREAESFGGTIQEYAGIGRKAEAPVSESAFASQEWEYDAADNLKRHYEGLAVNGTDLSNMTEYEYNSRDLLIKSTAGIGDANPFVTSVDYDEKGRASGVTVDPDDNTQSEYFSIIYDGFDRITQYSDPMGNQMSYEYDNNHNVVESYFTGPVSFDSSSSPETSYTLYSQSYDYDNRDRMTLRSVDIFDYDYTAGTGPASGAGPHGVSQQTTSYVYNRDSSVRSIIEISGDAATDKRANFYYDTASRIKFIEDNDFNTTMYEYDSESNVERLTRSEQSTLVGGSFEVYTVDQVFDALDRLISSTDGAGNLSGFKFDSRSNMIKQEDPRGNITRLIYDGMNRMTMSSVDMTDTGDGGGVSITPIETHKAYDDSNRLISETDDNGNTTSYEYDGLNRITKAVMPDGEDYTTTYDHNGNIETFIDARGVVSSNTYDLNNRLVTRVISGTSIPGATSEIFQYDGMGRLRTAINKIGTDGLTKIVREYDSRSNVVREVQNVEGPSFPELSDRVVQYEHDDANNMTQIAYPSGRVIDRAYDQLNRLIGIADPAMTNTSVSEFKYIGNRLQRRIHGNGTRTDYGYNGYEGGLVHIDDHGFGRVAEITTTKSGTGTVLDSFTFRWDESQNRTSYKDVGSGMKNRRERLFGYDSSDRLISTDVDFPDPNTDFTNPTNSGITNYDLDGVHNRFSVTGFEEAGAPIGIYKDAAVDTPDHVSNNQYTYTPHENGGTWINTYDENGNLVFRAEHNISDFTDDYVLDGFDLLAFMAALGNEDPEADLDNDGLWGFFDITIFLANFETGTQLDHEYFTYDFKNQLIDADLKSGYDTIRASVHNTYDPFARRVIERSGVLPDTLSVQMVYGCASLWEVIEQIQLAEGANPEKLLLTHVYGLGIDDEVSYRIENLTLTEDFWAHRDDLNSLTSVTDINGDIKERYQYGDYGQVTIFDPTGIERAISEVGATHLYTGRSLITGTGLQDSRWRVLDLETGRFVQRDPLGYIDSMNVYVYVVSNPLKFVDPLGLILTVVGDDAYRESVEKALQEISPSVEIDDRGVVSIGPSTPGNEEGHKAIKNLIDSIFDNVVKNDRPGKLPSTTPSNDNFDVEDCPPDGGPPSPGSGADATVHWDPDTTWSEDDPGMVGPRRRIPDSVILGHELAGHAQEFNNGTDTGDDGDYEAGSRIIEDILRDEMGYGPRPPGVWPY
ncbi:MAG: hypothetical protein JKY43_08435 [Phycisphaerales bacterium]|nr:hypothetical protein [Phycisphaerales bacterium]